MAWDTTPFNNEPKVTDEELDVIATKAVDKKPEAVDELVTSVKEKEFKRVFLAWELADFDVLPVLESSAEVGVKRIDNGMIVIKIELAIKK